MKQLLILCLLALSLNVRGQDGKFIETNGAKLYYEIHGQGDVLLLLHGNTMNLDMWSPWMADLSKKYKVITVDLRGHGKSSYPANEATHKQYALDLYGLLDAIGIDKFRAMGFSTGAMTLLHMATMHSDRFKSLVLIGGAPYFTTETRKKMKTLSYDDVVLNNPDWVTYTKNIHPGGDDQLRGLFNNYVRWAAIYDDMNFTAPYLSLIKCPTLIIHGDQDNFFPVEIPMFLYDHIPNAHLWIIPHFAHDTPEYGTVLGDLFLNTVLEFMSGAWND